MVETLSDKDSILNYLQSNKEQFAQKHSVSKIGVFILNEVVYA